MAKYVSNRQKNLKIGITSYTESQTVLEVTGKIGIGTTNATASLDVVGNTRLHGALYDQNNQVGSATSVLSSTGVGITWVNVVDIALQGLQGTQGTQGTQGVQGTQGIQGTQGVQGTQGTQGNQGLQGHQGTQGLQGDQGTQGLQGNQGTQGVIANFQGTQGLQGDQGTQGLQGPLSNFQGTQGSQGTQGLQGTQGRQGVQGGGGQGTQGSQGVQGTQGRANQGTQGAQGTQGFQGTQGTQGLQGIQGNRGFTGDSVQGNQGVQSSQGTQGLQGTQGRQGVQGLSHQGAQGVQGIDGVSGGKGAQGSQGVQGTQGVNGRTSTTPYTVMNFESSGDLNISGVSLTTISAYNIANHSGNEGIDKDLDELPESSVIAVFNGNSSGVSRFVATSRRIWLATISTLYFYVNKGGGSWGQLPEAGEGLTLQYSHDGSNWTTFTGQNISPDTIAGSNNWILRNVTVPEDAKSYGGVLVRLIQTSHSGSGFDTWAVSSILIATGGSSGSGGSGSSVVLLDTSNEFSVVQDKTLLTTRNSFNTNISIREPAITGTTPICIFGPDADAVGGDRSIATINKVYLVNVDTIEFYVNQAGSNGSTSWGEEPDIDQEDLTLQYSYNGSSWVGIHTMDKGSPDENRWLQQIVKIPDVVKSYNGVYLRLYQGSTTSGDNWAHTSIVVRSFSSNNNTSFSIFDFSSPASTSNKGTELYTISEYNNIYHGGAAGITNITDVPLTSSICVFNSNYDRDIDDRRTCQTTSKIYLLNVPRFIFYVNKGGGTWGDSPDSGEDLKFEYSFSNSESATWTSFHTISRSSGTNNETTTYVPNSNVWTKLTVTTPTEIKNYSGVYLRFKQNNVSGSGDDTWAISSVLCGLDDELTNNFIINDNSNAPVTKYVGLMSATSGIVSETYVSSNKLTFNQSSGTLSASAFASLSDISKKINIQEIKDPIGITQQLVGVRFDWIDTNKPSIGLIAQEVEKIIPEVIETDVNGYKTVNYDALIPILIESIKDHEKRIKVLEIK